MRHDRATEETRETAALYALGALSQHEARAFEIHLAEGCDVCAAERRRFSRATAILGLAFEEHPCPDYLRDILLERIGRETQVPADEGSEPTVDPAPPAAGRRGFARVLPWLCTAVGAALARGWIFTWTSARTEAGRLRAELSEARAVNAKTRDELGALASRSTQLDRILEMAGRQGLQSARLVGQPATPTNSGMILWDADRRQCLVIASLLPAPPGGVYQLWFSSPGTRVPVGVLEADAHGRVHAQLPTPAGLERVLAAIVTLEPAPGSAAPQGPFCATGQFH